MGLALEDTAVVRVVGAEGGVEVVVGLGGAEVEV